MVMISMPYMLMVFHIGTIGWGGGGGGKRFFRAGEAPIFMPPTRKGARGIMFSGCPSVRESRYREISRTTWWIFYHTWPSGSL